MTDGRAVTSTVAGWVQSMRARLPRRPVRVPKPKPTASVPMATETRVSSQALPQLAQPEQLRFTGTALLVLGFLLLGFVFQFAGVSQLSYAREQQLALDDFRYQLANATAPVGQVGVDGKLLPLGTPVALIEIPRIDVRTVVGEGTSSDLTLAGPGHRRDTPLPGQLGASVIYGRQAAYGGPFGALDKLQRGNIITATTGQGVSTYRVVSVRYSGDPLPAAMEAGEGRLTLVSAAGLPFLPDTIIRVDAKLETDLVTSPGRVLGYAALGEDELTMAGNSSSLPLLVLTLILLVVTLALFALSRRYWGTWQTWIVAIPVLFALGSFGAQQLAIMLPNMM